MIRRPPSSTRTDTLFPYTTLFRSNQWPVHVATDLDRPARRPDRGGEKPFWAALPLKPSTDAPMGRYRRPRSRDRRQMPCRLAPVSDQAEREMDQAAFERHGWPMAVDGWPPGMWGGGGDRRAWVGR